MSTRWEGSSRLHLLPTAESVVCSVSVTGRTVTSPDSLLMFGVPRSRERDTTYPEFSPRRLRSSRPPTPPLPELPMALFGRSKTTVGLDIGSGLIKVAVVDHSRKEPELIRAAVVPLLADAIVEGEVMDPGIVAEAIQAALAAADVKGKRVVTAVGGRDVIIKKIQIERVREQQARELMRWEAEQHVPFDMESVEMDFQILDPEASGVEMSVLLVAAKRELIESKMRILTDAGLLPGVVDVDAFALH
ncbi:MAG TPA: pilus assembly protein PilM, partial [Gemmatimonadaceae bacterium]